MRYAEYNMEITDGQQFLAPFSEPLLACVNLALWAVPIPARMEFDLLIATVNALIAMPAKSSCAAAGDGIKYLLVCPRVNESRNRVPTKRMTSATSQRGAVTVGYFLQGIVA